MMIVQNLQFPREGEKEEHLYIRYDNKYCILDTIDKRLIFNKRREAFFDTLFNSFSYEKWRKYTILDNLSLKLRLQGVFEVTLVRLKLNGERISEYVLSSTKVASTGIEEFVFKYPPCPAKGIVSFKIIPFETGVFYGGAYCTELEEADLPDIHIAVCICTYKREEYIKNNMEMLNRYVFSDTASMLHNKVRVYIADNGKTLQDMPSDKIKVIPNINSGGSGGFSRGMLEALADKERYGLTHVLLMDDDVVFTHYALERTYVFLRLLKKENSTIMLGGAMMKLDEPFMQHAAGESIINSLRILSSKGNFNMFSLHEIIRNEIEESINFVPWWYCCFPLEESLRENLSLPLFMQGDDIEFGLRNAQMKKVTLNGVCLWHESFAKKWNIQKDYYVIRNESIVLSIHDKSFTKEDIKKFIVRPIIRNILIYDYKSAELMLRGVEDYLKGFEWLTQIDPQELNNEIMSIGNTLKPLEELPMPFNYQEYRKSLIYKETKVRRFFRILLLNGLFLRANGDICAPVNNPLLGNPLKSSFYRARRVLNYDESAQKGFITEKSLKETFRIILRMIRVFHALDKRFDKTVLSYREEYKRYITEDFWRKFLKLEA